MKRELETLEIEAKDIDFIWLTIARQLLDNPDAVLPMRIKGFDNNELGKFYASFVDENQKLSLQVEGFTPPELAENFLMGCSDKWQIHPGGIYRLEGLTITR